MQRCRWPEEGVKSLGTGVREGCEPFMWVLGITPECSGNAARHENTEGEAGPEEEETRKTCPEDHPKSQLNQSDHHGLYFRRVPTTMFHEVGLLKQRKFLLLFRRPEGQ